MTRPLTPTELTLLIAATFALVSLALAGTR